MSPWRSPPDPHDPSEPPGGDFVRYIERLGNRVPQSGAASARAPSADLPANPSANPSVNPSARTGSRRPAGEDTDRPAIVRRTGSQAQKIGALLIGIGIASILLAVVPDRPWIDSPLPGMILAGAGIALRNRFRS